MSSTITGIVKDGVIAPLATLPEGAQVEIRLHDPPGPEAEEASGLFRQLAEQWRSETAHLSNIRKKALHPAYQAIIGMGALAVPLILTEMSRQPGQWFWALHAITGVDPVAEEERGQLPAMTAAWLAWGRQHDYRV